MALTGSLPSSLPSKKRKASEGAVSSRTGDNVASSSATSPSATFSTRLSTIQSALVSSADLNPLADLIALVKSDANQLSSSAVIPALSLVVRTFTQLVQKGSLQPWPVSRATGWLLIEAQPASDQVVHNWLKTRFNESVCALAYLAVTHPKDKVRVASLNALMELQRVVSESHETPTWSDCPWRAVVEATVAGKASPSPGEPSDVTATPEVSEGLRHVLVHNWAEKYLDVKLALLKSLKTLSATSISRSVMFSVVMAMTNPPATRSAIKAGEFLVGSLASAPAADGLARPSTKKGRKGGKAKGKRKISQDGDSDEEQAGSDDDESSEGEDDVNWFSDSDEEAAKEDENTTPSKLAANASKGKTNGAAIRRRRRGGASSLPLHQALHDGKAWKVLVEAVWLAVILGGSPKAAASVAANATSATAQQGTGLSLGEINAVLRVMEKRVLPYLSRPQLVADWLMDCLDTGGSTALLSLQPLFTLYVSASLSLPTLYTTLYTLLTPALLHSPHRSHSLRLIYLFLSSEKLSLSIVAAFVKRLARCALRGPPGGIITVVVMTYNLLKKHKEAMALLHRDYEDGNADATFVDPYDSDLQTPPSSSHALESCLYEFVTLGAQPSNPTEAALQQREIESHYHAPTSTIVRMLAQPFTKESYDVEEFLDHSYSTLLATEFRRLLNEQGLAGQGGESTNKRQRNAPPPAVRFALPGSTTSLAKDGVTKRVKAPKVFPVKPTGETAKPPVEQDVDGAEEQTLGDEDEEEMLASTLDPNEPGLDEEEREAREAMRLVEVENRRREKLEAQNKRRKLQEKQRVADPMLLWAF